MNKDEIVHESQVSQQATLEEQCSDWLQQKSAIKTYNSDLDEAKKAHPRWGEYAKLKVEADKLYTLIMDSEDVKEIKTNIEKAKGRVDLLNIIIIERINEQQLSFFAYKDKGQFDVKNKKTLKYEKKKEKKGKKESKENA